MIKVENLTKSYLTKKGRHYVFKDLNFELPPKKSIALLGRNGAGKSTLLRMIGGIDHPDSGKITTNKTISWPVGLSGGFQGSLTGRENVKFVARLYSKKSEVRDKISFVERFSELGKYFDMPIKTYSSGMRSRLGFGLSIAFDFDYYLIDEVTAVGDARFRRKCDDIFSSRRKTSDFIMVSHSLWMMKKYCDMALFIGRDNNVFLFENINEAIAEYQREEANKC